MSKRTASSQPLSGGRRGIDKINNATYLHPPMFLAAAGVGMFLRNTPASTESELIIIREDMYETSFHTCLLLFFISLIIFTI